MQKSIKILSLPITLTLQVLFATDHQTARYLSRRGGQPFSSFKANNAIPLRDSCRLHFQPPMLRAFSLRGAVSSEGRAAAGDRLTQTAGGVRGVAVETGRMCIGWGMKGWCVFYFISFYLIIFNSSISSFIPFQSSRTP